MQRPNYRLYLSPPEQTGGELAALQRVLESNWLAPVGPELDAFEQELAQVTQQGGAVATVSGAAALHLALLLAGVEPGHTVLCPTSTYMACANAIVQCGAQPVFVDCLPHSLTPDPQALEDALKHHTASGAPPVLLLAHLYGVPLPWRDYQTLADRYQTQVVEDAAECLGGRWLNQPVGGLADWSILSFNGNKLLTTGGGGALLCRTPQAAEHARWLAGQARNPGLAYQHGAVGYTYRMSNLLAAVGRTQLQVLAERVAQRSQRRQAYRELLASLPGLQFLEAPPGAQASWWLTVLRLPPQKAALELCAILAKAGIESRPVWSPLHLQPPYRQAEYWGGQNAQYWAQHALCLPSGPIAPTDREEICNYIRTFLEG